MNPSRTLSALAVAGLTLGFAASSVTASAPPDGSESPGQVAADAAIAAIDASLTDAGFVGDGETSASTDVLDLASEGGLAETCAPELGELADEAGSLLGEQAAAGSETYFLVPDGGELPESFDELYELDNTRAAVAIVEEANATALHQIADVFGSGDLADCIDDQLSASAEGQDVTYEIEFESEDDLGIGDATGALVMRGTAEVGGESEATTLAIAVAITGNAIVMADFESHSADADTEPFFAAVVAAVEALEV